MEDKKMMSIVNEDGQTELVEVVVAYEKDENGNVTVYVSNVDRSEGEPRLLGVESDDEWERIKDVLRELSKPEDDSEIEAK